MNTKIHIFVIVGILLLSIGINQEAYTSHPPSACHGSYYLNANFMTFNDAEAAAVGFGGHLATIRSSSQNDEVLALASGNGVWIGFNDIATEGTFEWTSDQAVTYTNWAGGQPDNFNGIEDATAMLPTGLWNDAPVMISNLSVYEIFDTDCDGVDDDAEMVLPMITLAGDVTITGDMTCSGCVDSADIADGTIDESDFHPFLFQIRSFQVSNGNGVGGAITKFVTMTPFDTSICYLTSVGLENTDTDSEFVSCRIHIFGPGGAANWRLSATAEDPNDDAQISCQARCFDVN